MSIQDPQFWHALHETPIPRPVGLKRDVSDASCKAESQRISATLLLAITLWSRDCTAGSNDFEAEHEEDDHFDVSAHEPFDVQAGRSSSLTNTPRLSGQIEWSFDQDEYPRHQEAVRRARHRLRLLKHHRDPFHGPTPQESTSAALLSPGGGGGGRLLSSVRNIERLDGQPLTSDSAANRRPAVARPADAASIRLLQDILLFARRSGAQKLQSKHIQNAGGALSVGHTGTLFIDVNGRAGDIGVTTLPPDERLEGKTFRECACLDTGVALLSDRGNVYFSGSFREHAPEPPRRAGGGGTRAPTSGDACGPNCPLDDMRTVLSRCERIEANRSRLAALTETGAVVMLSPTAIAFNPVAGVQPYCQSRCISVGQGNDVFFIDEKFQLQKCTASQKTCTTPRRTTTLLAHPVFTVSAGYNFVMAVDTSGGIWAHGRNEKGQLGVGSADDVIRVFTPDMTLRSKQFVTGVACGRQHAVAVTSSGAVFVCGDNRYGQLGLSPDESEQAPHRVANTVNRWTRLLLPGPCVGVACGTFSTLFVLEDGRVLGAGNNDYGQLGLLPACSVVSPPVLVDCIADRGGLLGVPCKALPSGPNNGKVGDGCCTGCIVA